jgi:large subunit ribosomal protein L24
MTNLGQTKISLRKNDQVQVMAGRDKGKTGKILKVDSKAARVTVEKVNIVKRHTRPTQKSAGGIVEKELPLHVSNVLLLCPKCNRGVRHGQKIVQKAGKQGTTRSAKIRVCKRCGESLDLA